MIRHSALRAKDLTNNEPAKILNGASGKTRRKKLHRQRKRARQNAENIKGEDNQIKETFIEMSDKGNTTDLNTRVHYEGDDRANGENRLLKEIEKEEEIVFNKEDIVDVSAKPDTVECEKMNIDEENDQYIDGQIIQDENSQIRDIEDEKTIDKEDNLLKIEKDGKNDDTNHVHDATDEISDGHKSICEEREEDYENNVRSMDQAVAINEPFDDVDENKAKTIAQAVYIEVRFDRDEEIEVETIQKSVKIEEKLDENEENEEGGEEMIAEAVDIEVKMEEEGEDEASSEERRVDIHVMYDGSIWWNRE